MVGKCVGEGKGLTNSVAGSFSDLRAMWKISTIPGVCFRFKFDSGPGAPFSFLEGEKGAPEGVLDRS